MDSTKKTKSASVSNGICVIFKPEFPLNFTYNKLKEKKVLAIFFSTSGRNNERQKFKL